MSTSQSPIFSLLSLSDYSEYLELLNEFRPTDLSYDEFKIIFNQIQNSGTAFVYVLREKEKGPMIGTAKLLVEHKFYHGGKNVAHIEDVIVKSTQRGKKYGSLLIEMLSNIAILLDCYKMVLQCENKLVPFYSKLGFENKDLVMVNYLNN